MPSLCSKHFQTDLRAGVGRLWGLVWALPSSFFFFFLNLLFSFLGQGQKAEGENCPALQTVAGFIQKGLTGNSCSSYRERLEQLGPPLFSGQSPVKGIWR